eukprot:GEMP01003910.1.p1 GENE.GEMP01003910.1~~GEMP01003910.1.p1  ORF type:complete len:1262 (+),score=264.97 GEMP01003910.1:23-3808(+)
MFPETLHSVRRFLCAKYGNLVRAWRAIATCDRGLVGCDGYPSRKIISFGEWCQALRKLGFEGDLRLTSENASFMSLEKLDAKSHARLRLLHQAADWDFLFAKYPNAKQIPRGVFLRTAATWGLKDAGTLFLLLSHNGEYLAADDIDFCNSLADKPGRNAEHEGVAIDGKLTEAFMRAKEDTMMQREAITQKMSASPNAKSGLLELKEFQKQCRAKHGSVENAWKLMDKKNMGKLKYEGFVSAVDKMGFEMDPKALWSKICTSENEITLDTLIPEKAKIIDRFREAVISRYGSFPKFFKTIDPAGEMRVSKERFLPTVQSMSFRGNAKTLFDFWDAHNVGSIFLDVIDADAVGKLYGKNKVTQAKNRPRPTIPKLPHLREDRERMGSRNSVKLASVHLNFLRYCMKHFCSTVRAWRHLDTGGLGSLNKIEFAKAIRAIGYTGQPTKLWEEVSRNNRVTIDDIDPKVAKECVHLGMLMCKAYKGFTQAFTQMEGTHGVDYETFEHVVRWKFKRRNAKQLFAHMNSDPSSAVLSVDDFLTLELVYKARSWKHALEIEAHRRHSPKIRVSLLEERSAHLQKVAQAESARNIVAPDFKARFLKMLIKKYGSLVKAFRLGFDRQGTKEVTVLQFFNHCGLLRVKNPDTIWDLLDPHGRGVITLEAFDPDAENELVAFKECVMSRYGKIENWLEHRMEEAQTFRMTLEDFRRVCDEVGYRKNPKTLWALLDLGVTGVITADQIDEFVAQSIFDPDTLANLKTTPSPSEQKAFKKDDTDSTSLAPELTTLTKKDKRAAKNLKERERFMTHVLNLFKTPIQAWHLCINPNGHDRLTMDDFFEAVKEMKYAKDHIAMNVLWKAFGKHIMPAPDANNHQSIWQHTPPVPSDKDFFSLRDLDPKMSAVLDLFKEGLLLRFGTLASAFEAMDKKREDRITFEDFDNVCFESKFQKGRRQLRTFLEDPKEPMTIELRRIDAGAQKEWNKKKYDLPPLPIAPVPTQRDLPSECFCAYLTKRYGTTTRAWQKYLDPKGVWKLSRDEFVGAVQATGWKGPVKALWRQMQPWATFPRMDKDGWEILTNFHTRVLVRLKRFEKAFDPPLELQDLGTLCGYIGIRGHTSQLFDLLNVEEAKTLACPEWLPEWIKFAKKAPKRNKADFVKPLKKAKTILSSAPLRRNEWNGCHEQVRRDPILSMLHELIHVNTENRKHFSDRVAKKMQNESIDTWHKKYLVQKQKKTELAILRAEYEEKQRKKASKEAKKAAEVKVIRDSDL